MIFFVLKNHYKTFNINVLNLILSQIEAVLYFENPFTASDDIFFHPIEYLLVCLILSNVAIVQHIERMLYCPTLKRIP